MGSLFRSEEMTLCQLFLQSESAYWCVAELAELGLVQFRDLNSDVNAFQRKFVNEVRRCEEMERKLSFLENELLSEGMPIAEVRDGVQVPEPREMIELETMLEKLEEDTREINYNSVTLKENYRQLCEMQHVLNKTRQFFHEMSVNGGELMPRQRIDDAMIDDNESGYMDNRSMSEDVQMLGQPSSVKLGFLAGVIPRDRLPGMERMLWRATHGNVFLRHTEIDEPLEEANSGKLIHKSVFVVFMQGDLLSARVKKICNGYRASLYPCPESAEERLHLAVGIQTRIDDLAVVLQETREHRQRVLANAAANLGRWIMQVGKIKAIYYTLNQMSIDVTSKCLIAECWLPVADIDAIQRALWRGSETSGAEVPSILNRLQSDETPPTFFRTNKFTQGFQALVDAYGVADYGEINPAPFAVITFPFLFGVMFGDVGHGLIMTAIAFWMIWKERWIISRRPDGEIFRTIFAGRYIILLMGLFSMYAGFIYNDCFGKPLKLFESGWSAQSVDTVTPAASYKLDPNDSSTWSADVYPFGLDPLWPLAVNKIVFTNTLKMKMSIMLGLAQMFFGLALSYRNHRFFSRTIAIWCEFLPQVVFLSCMFAYLIVLVVAKWFAYGPWNSGEAPALLNTLINMFLFKYDDASSNFYTGQQTVQSVLVLIAIACVPLLLFGKPFFMRRRSRVAAYEALPTEDSQASNEQVSGQEQQQQEELSDILIIQAIHTIEFCIGCISNTASYLRLWALSLAHSQLSEVLWGNVLRMAFAISSSSGLIVGTLLIAWLFAFWASATLGILLCMEGMSAFLHALRLHWVEFQNKFYSGTGEAFRPLSFREIADASRY